MKQPSSAATSNGREIGCATITGMGISFTQFVLALAQNMLLALVLASQYFVRTKEMGNEPA